MNERDGHSLNASEPRETELGAILVEVIDRRRSGEMPSLAEYLTKFPHLEVDLRGHFQMLDLLECPLPPAEPVSLGEAIAALSETLQRVIFLRNFRHLCWEEIAHQVGRPEDELRRDYARALAGLLAETAWASRTGTSNRDG